MLDVEKKYEDQVKQHQHVRSKFENLEELTLANQQKTKERFRKILERYDGQEEDIKAMHTGISGLRAGLKKVSEECVVHSESLNALKGPLVKGLELRVKSYGLRVTGYGLRVKF